jgi:predicted MFS family arabinose efflux permease
MSLARDGLLRDLRVIAGGDRSVMILRMPQRPRHILPVIVVSQLAGTSLWFAANAVLPDLQAQLGLPPGALGHMTAAVQLGFIAGTLLFAVLAISDRYSPRVIFLGCALLGAVFNAATYLAGGSLALLMAARFAVGFFLAGIYPVGMKIASGWYRDDLGKALGYLVGALVLGIALPHLIRGLGQSLAWEAVVLSVSGIAAAGGLLMYALVPDGPLLVPGKRFKPTALATVFRSRGFRASSFGYFGHQWEIYAFWAFVPAALAAYAEQADWAAFDVSLLSFGVIAIGSVGCIAGGYLSLRLGSSRVAFAQLAASGLCCLLSPLLFHAAPLAFVGFLLVWGIVVVGDSPQFSALNARHAPADQVGSALTIVNCAGFAITIVSIQLLNEAADTLPMQWLFLLLLPGPLLGLWALRPLLHAGDQG